MEDLTGLTELHSSTAALAMMESDEEEGDGDAVITACQTDSGGSAQAAAGSTEEGDVKDDWLEL